MPNRVRKTQDIQNQEFVISPAVMGYVPPFLVDITPISEFPGSPQQQGPEREKGLQD